MQVIDTAILPALVDELTEIQTQLAVLTSRANEIKVTLESTGLKEVCGLNTRAVISRIAESTTVSWKSLAESFSPSAAEIAAFSSKKEAYFKVEVKGYNVKARAA